MAEGQLFSQLLEFDADGEFARGFEAGRIWTVLQDETKREHMIGQVLHASNSEMLLRIADALDLTITAEPQDDIWVEITAIHDA